MRARFVLAAIAWLLAAGAGHGTPSGVKLTDAELDEVRGGFITADGYTFAFAAVVTTYIDGSLALQSTLRLDSGGANMTTVYGAIPGARTGSAGAVGGVNLAGATATLEVPGSGGETTIVQNVSPTSLVNLVINTANNQVIRQNTTVTLTLANLSSIEAAAAQVQANAALQAALASTVALRNR
jgi:hypothetical protein